MEILPIILLEKLVLLNPTEIGEISSYNSSSDISIPSAIGKYYAISSFSAMTFTDATIIKSAQKTDPGTVTYSTYLYIVQATASTIKMRATASQYSVYIFNVCPIS